MHSFDAFRILSVLALVALAGCAIPQPASPGPTAESFKKIAIVTALGDHATINKITLDPTGTRESALAIADWGLDDQIVSVTKQFLEPRYSVVKAKYAIADYAGPDAPMAKATPAERLARLKLAPDIEAVLFVLQISQSDPSGTKTDLSGLGSYHYGTIRRLYAFYELTLVDARTGKTIEERIARVPQNAFMGKRRAYVARDNTLDADTADTMTPEQKSLLKTGLTDLVASSLKETLTIIKLTGYAPEPQQLRR
jgi:hypothetical protein